MILCLYVSSTLGRFEVSRTIFQPRCTIYISCRQLVILFLYFIVIFWPVQTFIWLMQDFDWFWMMTWTDYSLCSCVQVMTNLYHEVASRVYQLQTPPLIRDRRHGRPRYQHNSSMCQACRQGLCKTSKVLTIVSNSSWDCEFDLDVLKWLVLGHNKHTTVFLFM